MAFVSTLQPRIIPSTDQLQTGRIVPVATYAVASEDLIESMSAVAHPSSGLSD